MSRTQYLRYRDVNRPSVCAYFSALLSQLCILDALLQLVDQLHHVPFLQDFFEVDLPCAVELVDDLAAQSFERLRRILRGGGEAGCEVLGRAFVERGFGGLVEDVDQTLGAWAGGLSDRRCRRRRGRSRMRVCSGRHGGV